MKAIHNTTNYAPFGLDVVLYPKDTEKWKQFTTMRDKYLNHRLLFCIPKILKNESNSQPIKIIFIANTSCFVSQRYWKMKAIHNTTPVAVAMLAVVLYPKDTEKWKQFTTIQLIGKNKFKLFCIPKILKNESNSQLKKKTKKNH